jgi:8-oxo-dGTP diphosphatase
VWDVPGGHCEPGEPPERTLVRELQEELGVTPTAWRPLGVFRAGPGEPEGGLALHLYAVSAWTGEPHNRLPEEHSEVEWFAVEDACGLELAHPGYPAVFRAVSDQGG